MYHTPQADARWTFIPASILSTMSIGFTSAPKHAEFYSSMSDFVADAEPVEYREDPLTREQSRIIVDWF